MYLYGYLRLRNFKILHFNATDSRVYSVQWGKLNSIEHALNVENRNRLIPNTKHTNKAHPNVFVSLKVICNKYKVVQGF